MLPLMPDVKELIEDEKIFGESYDSEESDELDDVASGQMPGEIEVKQYGSESEGNESEIGAIKV